MYYSKRGNAIQWFEITSQLRWRWSKHLNTAMTKLQMQTYITVRNAHMEERIDIIMVTFEENYIFRNHRSITSNSDIALTEFIANAWDAGAHNVNITIPFEEHEEIIVEDDGTGLTDEEFHSRWMTLNWSCLPSCPR